MDCPRAAHNSKNNQLAFYRLGDRIAWRGHGRIRTNALLLQQVLYHWSYVPVWPFIGGQPFKNYAATARFSKSSIVLPFTADILLRLSIRSAPETVLTRRVNDNWLVWSWGVTNPRPDRYRRTSWRVQDSNLRQRLPPPS